MIALNPFTIEQPLPQSPNLYGDKLWWNDSHAIQPYYHIAFEYSERHGLLLCYRMMQMLMTWKNAEIWIEIWFRSRWWRLRSWRYCTTVEDGSSIAQTCECHSNGLHWILDMQHSAYWPLKKEEYMWKRKEKRKKVQFFFFPATHRVALFQ